MGVGARLNYSDNLKARNDILKAKGICNRCKKNKCKEGVCSCNECINKYKAKRIKKLELKW